MNDTSQAAVIAMMVREQAMLEQELADCRAKLAECEKEEEDLEVKVEDLQAQLSRAHATEANLRALLGAAQDAADEARRMCKSMEATTKSTMAEALRIAAERPKAKDITMPPAPEYRLQIDGKDETGRMTSMRLIPVPTKA